MIFSKCLLIFISMVSLLIGKGLTSRSIATKSFFLIILSKASNIGLKFLQHKKRVASKTADPLLGELIPLPSKDILFRNEIDLNLLPYFQDHKIFHNIIFPGAGFAELLMRAGRHLFPNQSFTIKNFSFEQPLMLYLSKTTTIELYAKPKDDGYAVSRLRVYCKSELDIAFQRSDYYLRCLLRQPIWIGRLCALFTLNL